VDKGPVPLSHVEPAFLYKRARKLESIIVVPRLVT